MKASVVTIWLFMLSVGGVVRADSFELVTGDDYPPFTGTKLPKQGLATEIVQSTFSHMGHETSIIFKPWKRGFQDTAAGKYLATFPYGKNPERLEDFHYSEPLYKFGQYFFALSSSEVNFDNDEDLQGLRVCLPLGYNPVRLKTLEEEGIVTLVRPPDLESCFQMLVKSRTDLVRVNDIVGWAMIDENFSDRSDFQILEKPLRESIEHLIISKSHPRAIEFMEEFNTALLELQQQGKIQNLIEQHLH